MFFLWWLPLPRFFFSRVIGLGIENLFHFRTSSKFPRTGYSKRRVHFDSVKWFLHSHFNVILNYLSAGGEITCTHIWSARTAIPVPSLCSFSNHSVHFCCRKGLSKPRLTSLSHLPTNMHTKYFSISSYCVCVSSTVRGYVKYVVYQWWTRNTNQVLE